MAGNVFRFDPAPQQAQPHVPQAGSSVAPVRGPMVLATMALLIGSWPQPIERLPQLTVNSKTAVFAIQSQEPPRRLMEAGDAWAIRVWWPEDKYPYPAQLRLPQVIPITRGDQPPPSAAVELEESVVVAAWPPVWWPAQTMAPTAGWNVPLVIIPYVPPRGYPFREVMAGWHDVVAVELLQSGAAAFIDSGDQPPRVDALERNDRTASQSWPPVWYPSQRAAPNAGWNVPPLAAYLPFFRAPVRWIPEEWAAQFAKRIAPQTLIYGQQPPPTSWRTGPTLLKAWETDWAAQRSPRIVVLTLPTGQQPPRYSVRQYMLVRGLWLPETWAAQYADPVAAWVPPIAVVSLPVLVEDRSGFRYGVLDQSGKRYLVIEQSGIRYVLLDQSDKRYESGDQSAPRYDSEDRSEE